MRKTQLPALVLAALTLAACDSSRIPTATPLEGSSSVVDGRYDGTWTLSFEDDVTVFCPGSITLIDHKNGFSFEGSFLIEDGAACGGGSPVSGNVESGRVRDDGGVNFFMTVPPLEGQVKQEDDIWEDIFAGSGVVDQNFFSGCDIKDADNQMNGAVLGGELSASASAALTCEETLVFIGDETFIISDDVQIQVRFLGDL